MKKWIAMLLVCIIVMSTPMAALAESVEYEYPSIVVTFSGYSTVSETEFRNWAAGIIDLYIGITDIECRDYYKAAELVHEYDIDDTIQRTDLWGGYEVRDYHTLSAAGDVIKQEEWEQTLKQSYISILAETIQEKCATDSTFFANLDNEQIGKTWKFDSSTGKWEYSEALSSLNDIDNVKWQQNMYSTLTDIAAETIETWLKTKKVVSFNMSDSGKTLNDLGTKATGVVKDTLNGLIDAIAENQKNELMNAVNAALREEAANRIVKADQRIINYLKEIYINSNSYTFGSGTTWGEIAVTSTEDREKVLREAVNEVISIYEKHQENAYSSVDEVIVDIQNIDEIKEIFVYDTDTIVMVTTLEALKGILTQAISMCNTEIAKKLGDHDVVKLVIAPLFAAAEDSAKKTLDAQITGMKNGTLARGSVNIDETLKVLWAAVTKDLGKSLAKDGVKGLSSALSGMTLNTENGSTSMDAYDPLLKNISTITTILDKLENGESIDSEAFTLVESLVGYVAKNISTTRISWSLETAYGELEEAMSNVDEDKLIAAYNKINKLDAVQKVTQAINIIDAKAWADIGTGIATTVQDSVDAATDKSQASKISMDMYNTYRDLSYNNYKTLKALLVNDPNAPYDTQFGPNNVRDASLTSTERIATVLTMIFAQYEEDLVGMGLYMTLLEGNSDVRNYIVKYSDKNGGFPIVDTTKIAGKYNNIEALLRKWKNEQPSYAEYFAQ